MKMKKLSLIIVIIFVFSSLIFSQDVIDNNEILKNIVDDYIEVLKTQNVSSKVLKIEYNSIDETEYFMINGLLCKRELKNNPTYIFEYDNFIIVVYFGFEKYLKEHNLAIGESKLLLKAENILIKDTVVNDGGLYSNIYHNVIIDDFLTYKYSVVNNKIIKVERIIPIY